MKRWIKIALAVLLVASLGLAFWHASGPREPLYQGKPLSFWLRAYYTQRADADEAVRQAGAKALPTLLRMVRVRDSPLKLKLMALAQSQHIIKIEYWPAEDWNFAAQEEFSVLGTNAQSAVPALIEIVNQNISRHSQISAVEALGNIGPSAKEAVPALLGWTTNGDWLVRFSAIESLGKVGAEPDRVVPVLLNAFLHDPDVKIVAATALGEFGANAKPAVPALLEYFSAPDAATNRIANALKAIDPEAAAKAGVK